MGVKTILYLLTILLLNSCSEKKVDVEHLSMIVEEIMNQKQLSFSGINMPTSLANDDTTKSYLRIKLSNNSTQTIKIKGIDFDSFFMIYPTKAIFYKALSTNDNDCFINIIDCFDCVNELSLKPDESKTVFAHFENPNGQINRIILHFSYMENGQKGFPMPLEINNMIQR